MLSKSIFKTEEWYIVPDKSVLYSSIDIIERVKILFLLIYHLWFFILDYSKIKNGFIVAILTAFCIIFRHFIFPARKLLNLIHFTWVNARTWSVLLHQTISHNFLDHCKRTKYLLFCTTLLYSISCHIYGQNIAAPTIMPHLVFFFKQGEMGRMICLEQWICGTQVFLSNCHSRTWWKFKVRYRFVYSAALSEQKT